MTRPPLKICLAASEMAPLAKGFAEFTAIDLAKVKSLRVIDRLKIDMILDELQLSASGAVDPSTAPRMGKLLGSKHLMISDSGSNFTIFVNKVRQNLHDLCLKYFF